MPAGWRWRSSTSKRPRTSSPSTRSTSRPYSASKPIGARRSVSGPGKRRILAARALLSGAVSLEALAPDQRAVVQLVLQQDRSYEDLAGLLGISTDAVRERAHK